MKKMALLIATLCAAQVLISAPLQAAGAGLQVKGIITSEQLDLFFDEIALNAAELEDYAAVVEQYLSGEAAGVLQTLIAVSVQDVSSAEKLEAFVKAADDCDTYLIAWLICILLCLIGICIPFGGLICCILYLICIGVI